MTETESESPDTLERIETILSATAACIENRCYAQGSVSGIRYVQLLVRRDLARIDELLLEDLIRDRNRGGKHDSASPYPANPRLDIVRSDGGRRRAVADTVDDTKE